MGFYGVIKNGENKKYYPAATSTTAKINLGVCAGYNNDNEEVDDFENYLQKRLEKLSEELGFYIPFIVYEVKTVYKKEWGCPDGGEKTYNLEATRNPKFEMDDKKWREEVLKIISVLKEELKQSTVTLQFIPIEIVYMR